jgi:hypothetical protein
MIPSKIKFRGKKLFFHNTGLLMMMVFIRDYTFVESSELGNKYLRNQDSEYIDELEQ